MRDRNVHAIVVAAVALVTAPALADDAAQRAHEIMREALLQHAPRAAAEQPTGAARPTTSVAREHMGPMRRAEAERAAHQRAVGHGAMHSGPGRSTRNEAGAGTSPHGDTSGNSSGMGCQDAAGNQRTMDMHEGGMGGGGGMPGGGGMGGGGMGH